LKNWKDLWKNRWITRVPENIKQAKEHIAATKTDDMEKSRPKGYYFKEITENYAGIKQRWLIVFPQQAYDREYATIRATRKVLYLLKVNFKIQHKYLQLDFSSCPYTPPFEQDVH